MFKRTFIAAVAQQLPKAANAQVGEAVLRDTGEDFTRCAAVYGLVNTLMKRDQPNEDRSAFEAAAKLTETMGLAFLKDRYTSRFAVALDEIQSLVVGVAAGDRLQLVITKHGPLCKDVRDRRNPSPVPVPAKCWRPGAAFPS